MAAPQPPTFDQQGFNTLFAAYTQLNTDLTNANGTILQLQHDNHTLHTQFQALQGAQRAPVVRAPKVSAPPTFNGKKEESIDVFLSQIRLNIAVNHDRFPDDQSKVLYTLSFFKDNAGKWAEPIINSSNTPTPSPLLGSFALLEAEILKIFGQADKEGNAIRALTRLRQTGSAAEYKAQFMQIEADVPWDQKSKMHQFRRGLKDNVKDQLALMDPPANFEDLAAISIRIDTRLFERAEERRNSVYKTPFHSSRTGQASPDAMDIDTTKEEKIRRRKEGLCLLCGGKGHFARNCPKSKPKIKAMETEEEEQIPRTMPELVAALKAAGLAPTQEQGEDEDKGF